ncbi:MAG TPA: FAD-dependent monooxygenase [Trebonia sp.]|jgi:2-polyprenyl-6-methoxyphenol hydroxylase-like FAD-dependent oxidoreductase
MKVLIAGGGPTGLTLGIDLARRGVDVRVVDKADRFFDGSRGDGIQPRTLEVFDDLGVIDEVLEQGSGLSPIRVHLDGTFVTERWMAEPVGPTADRPYPNPWVLGQSQLEAVLRSRLASFGVRVELGTELVGLSQDDSGVAATLSTGETARFDYLAGADGGGSFVRKTLGVGFPGTTDESVRMLLGDVAADGLDPSCGYWFASAGDPMTGVVMTPLPGTPYFQFGTPLGDGDTVPLEILSPPETLSLETLQGMLDTFSAGIRLTGLGWSTVWRPNVRLADRYRTGRVFLAGDAAHVHPPTGGQGMNTGVQDAYNLGWKLASESSLDTYETERRAVAARVLGVSTGLLERYAEGDPQAHRRGEDTFGLTISYRSPEAAGALVTGDRAPDAPVLDASGKRIRLFDLFRGPHFTRLVFGGPAPEPGALPGNAGTEPEHVYAVLRPGDSPAGDGHDGLYVTDDGGHAFAAYAANAGRSVLVRPDGYLG